VPKVRQFIDAVADDVGSTAQAANFGLLEHCTIIDTGAGPAE